MRYEGLQPLADGAPEIEVVTPDGTFDLHNFGTVETIAFEPPRTLTVTVRCWRPTRSRVRLRFDGVDGLSGGGHEDNIRESGTWEHLIVRGDQVELWTGTHAFEFTATALAATVEPVFGSAIEPGDFQAAVHDCFVTRLGMTAVEQARYVARFERPPVVIAVGYDATRSWELDVWLGHADRADDRIDIAHAVEAIGCPRAVVAGLAPMQTGEPHVLRKLLARVADALEGCGAALLSEDGAALDRAFALRAAQAAEYERVEAAQYVLEAAEEAWAAKDLARLVDLLEPIRDRLPPRHARRLAFAEKRVRPVGDGGGVPQPGRADRAR